MTRASPGLLSFNTGEVSPRLDGRVDLDKYVSALKTMHNFVPTVQGPATKRAGTRFASEVRKPKGVTFFLDSFDVSTGVAGTTQARTGYGGTPKAILVFGTGQAGGVSAAGRAGSVVAFGFASSATARFAAAVASQDAVATMNTGRAYSTSAVYIEPNVTSGATVGLLDVQSFDADGVTFVIDDQFPAARRVTVLAILGEDVQAEVSSFAIASALGIQTAAVSTFEPDTALLATVSSQSAATGNAFFTLGCASGPNGAIENKLVSFVDVDGLGTSETGVYGLSGESFATPGTSSGLVTARALVAEWTSTGFDMQVNEAPTGNRVVGTLCLKGVNFTLGELLTQTDTVTDIVLSGLADNVAGGIIVSHCHEENTSDVRQDYANYSVGAFTGVGSQQAHGFASEHGQADSVVGTSLDVAAVYTRLAQNAGLVDGAMAVTAVGTGSVTLRMTNADPDQAWAWYLIGGDSDAPSAQAALIPFRFNSTDNYVLEFGGGYVRFFRDGGNVLEPEQIITSTTNATPVVVTTAGDHGYANTDDVYITGTGVAALDGREWRVSIISATTFSLDGSTAPGFTSTTGTAERIYEIASPYSESDVERLAYAQSADVLYLAHPGYAPYKLSRRGHTDWVLEPIDFDWFPFAPENQDETNYVAASAKTGTVTLTSPRGIFTASHVGSRFKFREVIETYQPEWIMDQNYADAGYAAFRPGSANLNVGDRVHFEGKVYEITDRHGVTQTGKVAPIHEDGIATDGRFDWRFVNYGYGYVLITAYTNEFTVTATVVKELPKSVVSAAVAITSTTAANPVQVTVAAHGLETGDKIFIRDVTTADELNDQQYTVTRTAANTFTLDGVDGTTFGAGAGGTFVQVYWASNANGAAVEIYPSLWRWSFGAWSADRGYPTSVGIYEDRLGFAGTEKDPSALWMSRSGRYEDHRTTQEDDSALVIVLNSEDRIEWLAPKRQLQIGSGGSEFTTTTSATDAPLAPGNVATRIVRQSDYGVRAVRPARVEQVVLFAQKAGRKLRELTPDVDSEAPDLTVLAEHMTRGLIRQMVFQSEPDRVLWVILEDGSLRGFTYERAQQVTGWHRHTLGGTSPLVESLAVIPHPDGDRDQLWMIVARTIAGETRRYVEVMEPLWIGGTAIEDAFFLDSGLSYDGAPATVIKGLHHLVGETVSALADGVSVGTFTVSAAGTVTLSSAASVVHLGYPYTAELEPMRIEAGRQDGVSQGKLGRVDGIVIRLEDTGAGLFIGPTIAEAVQEVGIAPTGLTSGDTEKLPWPGGYDQARRLALRHTKPTPCTITALLPTLGVE